jgi:hypothetical protein
MTYINNIRIVLINTRVQIYPYIIQWNIEVWMFYAFVLFQPVYKTNKYSIVYQVYVY